MNLQQRKELLVRLGNYMKSDDEQWQQTRQKAYENNKWFIPEFIKLSVESIANNYLDKKFLDSVIEIYNIPSENPGPKKTGIVMAGNIPLVGFHDFMAVFLTGHIACIKPSSKDDVLIRHLIEKLEQWDRETSDMIFVQEMVRNCDAYIATGSNNSSRYFEYYFQRYPSIIRKNRTSVAILQGDETPEELEKLADDVYAYFGLGCRNVTKIYVPEIYDFKPLLDAFKKYDHLAEHHKYKNNYDYNLAILMLNNKYYMTNGTILLVEDRSAISPVSQLHYEFYSDKNKMRKNLENNDAIQCIAGKNDIQFGHTQLPGICDYADGIDTFAFLMNLYPKI